MCTPAQCADHVTKMFDRGERSIERWAANGVYHQVKARALGQ